ncbi:ABC transporter ATP-binding protein [Candidatus Woesearchaeota archaeon]|nr:ABC transporter ATP-binding protein [Candidatus Woesearchaeota archaeon]
MTGLIHLKNVSKIYQVGEVEVTALKHINLEIKKGEFIAILGKSGSGKSTMLNSVGCLDTPTKGTIHLDEFDIEELHESELATIRGKKIGFIFQAFNLIPSLTALENVMLPMIFQGTERTKRLKRATELLTSVGLKDRMYHRPSQLSGGQQQRVAIARALANDPEVILADEPTGNLDSNTEKDIIKMLQDLHKRGKTIIMITHNEKLAQIAERVVHLKDGEIVNENYF